jgi:hypothetical protein
MVVGAGACREDVAVRPVGTPFGDFCYHPRYDREKPVAARENRAVACSYRRNGSKDCFLSLCESDK